MLIHLDNDSVQLGAWRYFNNVWNHASFVNGEDYSQSIVTDANGAIRVDWHWPQSEVVRAYPELMLGQSPWLDSAANAQPFPMQLDTIEALSIAFDVDWEAPANSSFNLAFEFWVSSDPAAGEATITNEVMIWIRSAGDFVPAGIVVERYSDDLGAGSIHDRRLHADASGTTARQWALTTLDYDTDIHAGTVDVAALLNHLVDTGLLDGSNYLMNAEFGAEIVSGSGSYSVRDLTITFADGTSGLLAPAAND